MPRLDEQREELQRFDREAREVVARLLEDIERDFTRVLENIVRLRASGSSALTGISPADFGPGDASDPGGDGLIGDVFDRVLGNVIGAASRGGSARTVLRGGIHAAGTVIGNAVAEGFGFGGDTMRLSRSQQAALASRQLARAARDR